MHVFYILFSLFAFCVPLCAQVVQIEYNGDLLSQDEREKIEKMLLHEAEFYSQFGMPDTLTVVQLFVFEKEKAALEYLKSLGITAAIPGSVTGLYIAVQQKIIMFGMDRKRKRNLSAIYHELNHHFACQILDKRLPLWLNEGLSEYFENCTVTKKGILHTFTEYELCRIHTMRMLGEIDLLKFVNSKPIEFRIEQRTNEGYSSILAHALVTFWIEELPRNMLKRFVDSLKDVDDSSTISERIDKIYSGGFKQFEKDFADFIHDDD